MDDNADRFLDLIHQLEDFTRTVSPDQAHAEFDETTLQLFWMRWPQLSAWAGSLWRLLSEELAGPRPRTTTRNCTRSAKVADNGRRTLTVGDVMHTRLVSTSRTPRSRRRPARWCGRRWAPPS